MSYSPVTWTYKDALTSQKLQQGVDNAVWTSQHNIQGFELVYADANHLHVNPGVLEIGGVWISKTAITEITKATDAEWWDGVEDMYGTDGWCYIGVNISGEIRFLGDNPPNKADTNGNTDGVQRYWFDGAAYWRVIGAVYIEADDETIKYKWFQQGNLIMWDVPIIVSATPSATAWSGALSCAVAIPSISTLGIFGLAAIDTAGATCGIAIRPFNGSANTPTFSDGAGGSQNEINVSARSGGHLCFTDSSQQIKQYSESVDTGCEITVEGYYLNIR